MTFETIKLSCDERGVATLTLARADKHNAMSELMLDELTAAARQIAANKDIRVVILSAEGKSFCAGGDLAWMRAQMDMDAGMRSGQAGKLAYMLQALDTLPQPLIGRIHGNAFGGGAGMVLMIEPIDACITALKAERSYDEVIYLTPDGETLNQRIANQLSLKGNVIMLCGHYKGVDQRVRDLFITQEISVGDYVLSGGELGAAILCDAVIRLLPGVLNDETSALTDSFQDDLLSPPVYTRPPEYNGWKVPDILLSGNTKLIDEWRHDQSLKRTEERRPDLLDND